MKFYIKKYGLIFGGETTVQVIGNGQDFVRLSLNPKSNLLTTTGLHLDVSDGRP